jgi:hypothetical protein
VTDADLVAIDQRIQRAGASNCWTGTLGSLATDARRLVRHIQEQRRMACEYPVDHILQGERELRLYPGDEMEPEATVIESDDAGPPVAVQLLDTARAAVLDRHRVYGPPDEHFARTAGAINALFGSILRRPITAADWGRMMIVDKLARDLGPLPHPDNPVDMAGYAACVASCLASAPPADGST